MVTGSSLWDISYYITVRYSRFLKILFTIKLEIRYLQVRCNYVRMKNTIQLLLMFGRHFGITFLGKLQYNCFAYWVVILRLCVLWYVCIMFVNNLIVTSLFLSLWRFFFNKSQLRYLFVQFSFGLFCFCFGLFKLPTEFRW